MFQKTKNKQIKKYICKDLPDIFGMIAPIA